MLKQQNKKVVRHVHFGRSASGDLLLWSLLATAQAEMQGSKVLVTFVAIWLAWLLIMKPRGSNGGERDGDHTDPRGDRPQKPKKRIRDYDDCVGSPYEESEEEPLPDDYDGRFPEARDDP